MLYLPANDCKKEVTVPETVVTASRKQTVRYVRAALTPIERLIFSRHHPQSYMQDCGGKMRYGTHDWI